MNYATRTLGGFTMLFTLILGTIFLTVLSATTFRVIIEHSGEVSKTERAQAFAIAEAGLEYYKWHLAKHPGDTTNGTGNPGPFTLPFVDPEEGEVGEYTLTLAPILNCGTTTAIDITSVGRVHANPSASVSLTGRYARPSIAEYAYIINDSVWAGADRVITGRYHTNGGVRMDGTANSSVTSARSTWSCTSSFGCSPASTTPGVWGAGPNKQLWEYPVPSFDFAGISQDFPTLKTLAQSDGLYFASRGGYSNTDRGWRLQFNADQTVTVWPVRRTSDITATHIDNTSVEVLDPFVITAEDAPTTYAIPSDCGIVYVEDRAWISGTVDGKVTVVVADTVQPSYNPDAIIRNDIVYEAYDGTDGLTLLSEGHVYIAPDSEDYLDISAIIVAQNGYFGRNLYKCNYASYHHKTQLTVRGTIVSNKREGSKWSYSDNSPYCPNAWSGYNTRVNAYDRRLAVDPPPFTPFISPEYRYIEWRENR